MQPSPVARQRHQGFPRLGAKKTEDAPLLLRKWNLKIRWPLRLPTLSSSRWVLCGWNSFRCMLQVGSPKSHAFDSKVQSWVTVMIFCFGTLLHLGYRIVSIGVTLWRGRARFCLIPFKTKWKLKMRWHAWSKILPWSLLISVSVIIMEEDESTCVPPFQSLTISISWPAAESYTFKVFDNPSSYLSMEKATGYRSQKRYEQARFSWRISITWQLQKLKHLSFFWPKVILLSYWFSTLTSLFNSFHHYIKLHPHSATAPRNGIIANGKHLPVNRSDKAWSPASLRSIGWCHRWWWCPPPCEWCGDRRGWEVPKVEYPTVFCPPKAILPWLN